MRARSHAHSRNAYGIVKLPGCTYVTRGRETLQMHGFPVQTYGRHSKCHIFNSKVWIKILSGQTPRIDMLIWKSWSEVVPKAPRIFYLEVKYAINPLILLWCGLITGLFCWAVSGRWFHSHNAPQLLLTTSWFLHFYIYGFLGPRPPRITRGRVVSLTRPRLLRHHLNYVSYQQPWSHNP